MKHNIKIAMFSSFLLVFFVPPAVVVIKLTMPQGPHVNRVGQSSVEGHMPTHPRNLLFRRRGGTNQRRGLLHHINTICHNRA